VRNTCSSSEYHLQAFRVSARYYHIRQQVPAATSAYIFGHRRTVPCSATLYSRVFRLQHSHLTTSVQSGVPFYSFFTILSLHRAPSQITYAIPWQGTRGSHIRRKSSRVTSMRYIVQCLMVRCITTRMLRHADPRLTGDRLPIVLIYVVCRSRPAFFLFLPA